MRMISLLQIYCFQIQFTDNHWPFSLTAHIALIARDLFSGYFKINVSKALYKKSNISLNNVNRKANNKTTVWRRQRINIHCQLRRLEVTNEILVASWTLSIHQRRALPSEGISKLSSSDTKCAISRSRCPTWHVMVVELLILCLLWFR